MADSMIERVARVLCAQSGQNPDQPTILGFQREVRSGMRRPGDGPFAWENYAANAHAVIAAMREPTEAMIEAARPCPEHLIEARKDVIGYESAMRVAASVDQMSARSDWHAMIDAALADSPLTPTAP